MLTGGNPYGKVLWGDGAEESYSSSLTHSYASAGSYTVTIKFTGSNAFEVATIAGIKEIDMTDF